MIPILSAAAGLPWVKPALLAIGLCAVFLGGWAARGVPAARDAARQEAQIERLRADHAAAVSKAASAALAQSEAHRKTESDLRRRVQEADHARAKESKALAARAAAADRAARSLRKQLDGFTCSAPASATAGDPGAASGDRTVTLGDVVGPLLSEYRAAVDAAEDHAAGVRALLAAWPSAQVKP